MRSFLVSLVGLGFAVGCAGQPPAGVPTGGDDEPDAGVDAPPELIGQRVSGKTMDYFVANTPMDEVAITSEGIDPQMAAVSLVGGDYALDDVPVGSQVYFTAARPLYRPTRNAPILVKDAPVIQDLYLMTLADVARQYATSGTLLAPGKAFLAAELRRNNGMPLEGIPLTDVTLVDALDQPVPGIVGPYAFGTLGDIDLVLTDATVVNGRSRIAILDVPPGNYTLKVTYPNQQNVPQTITTPVTFTADGATIAITGGMEGGGGNITNPTFAADIYPRLQKASAGGLGCANCHTLGGPAGAVLAFDDPAAVTLANMQARPGVIDLITPADSLLLTKPLYEPPPYNHPNATFIDINDPDYKLILLWIQQGAL